MSKANGRYGPRNYPLSRSRSKSRGITKLTEPNQSIVVHYAQNTLAHIFEPE